MLIFFKLEFILTGFHSYRNYRFHSENQINSPKLCQLKNMEKWSIGSTIADFLPNISVIIECANIIVRTKYLKQQTNKQTNKPEHQILFFDFFVSRRCLYYFFYGNIKDFFSFLGFHRNGKNENNLPAIRRIP